MIPTIIPTSSPIIPTTIPTITPTIPTVSVWVTVSEGECSSDAPLDLAAAQMHARGAEFVYVYIYIYIHGGCEGEPK